MSNYTLRLNYYQGAQLINYNFNDFTLHYSLSTGYIWDYRLLINTQQLLHLYTLHRNDGTVERATRCILGKTTEYYGHYLLTNTHCSDELHPPSYYAPSGTYQGLQQDTWFRSGKPELCDGSQHGSSTTKSSAASEGLLAQPCVKLHAGLQHQALPHELRSV